MGARRATGNARSSCPSACSLRESRFWCFDGQNRLTVDGFWHSHVFLPVNDDGLSSYRYNSEYLLLVSRLRFEVPQREMRRARWISSFGRFGRCLREHRTGDSCCMTLRPGSRIVTTNGRQAALTRSTCHSSTSTVAPAMSSASASDRLRRSTRTPAKTAVTVTPAPPAEKRGKQRDPEAQLDYLLTNSRSKVTTLDIAVSLEHISGRETSNETCLALLQDLLNYENFFNLSEESKELLCSLLPPTAFVTYTQTVDRTHSSGGADAPAASCPDFERNPATLDPTFFMSPFMLSAAHAWQDHIYSGFFSAKSQDTLAKYADSVHAGTLHAEWKDETWAREHPPPKRPAI